VLLVLLLVDRGPRRWYVPVAAGAVLSWVVIADRVALLTAAVPLALVCGFRVMRAILQYGRTVASQWYELSLIGASVASFVVGTLAVRLIGALHGYGITPVDSAKLAPLHHLQHALAMTGWGIVDMYGADFVHLTKDLPFNPQLGGLPMAFGVAIAVVHLVGLALAAWGFLRAFRYFFDPADLVSPVLATAIVVNVGAYIPSIISAWVWDAREIVAVLPFGAVLAGRMVPGMLARARLGSVRLTPVLAGGLAAVLACYLAALGYGAAQSSVAGDDQAVIPWLEAHHLTSGLGIYHEANIITLGSGGRVAIRDVAWRLGGPEPRSFESKGAWYKTRQSYANFILTNSADQWGNDGGGPGVPASMIPRRSLIALHAGPPAHVYHYKTFTIMVWNHNILNNLGNHPSVQPGPGCQPDCV
jgi:hypothetical protein